MIPTGFESERVAEVDHDVRHGDRYERRTAVYAGTIPGSQPTRVAPETLRHWLKDYSRGGFDALLPKGRADCGHARALPQAVADALLTLKDEQPGLRSRS